MPLISVIIPVYNVEQHIRKCVESVLAQTIADIEIICVDDCSTDNSLKILNQLAAEDKRITVVPQAKKGLSEARNNGLKHATADYIAFVDSDDFVHPQFLEKLYTSLCDYNADIAGCNYTKIHSDETLPKLKNIKPKKYSPALHILMHKKNFIHFNVWNKLYKHNLIKDISFVPGIYFEDWVYNSCVFAKAESFVWLDEKLYGYRISENSIMRSPFTVKKINDYVTGIHHVYKFYQRYYPEKWQTTQHSRVARTVKMLMNNVRRSKNAELMREAKIALKELYQQKLIGYRGLSLINKIKLFRFLH